MPSYSRKRQGGQTVGLGVRHRAGRAGGISLLCGASVGVVGRGRDHQPYHVFHVPPAFDELDRQPIEQLRVGRPLPLPTHVVQRAGGGLRAGCAGA